MYIYIQLYIIYILKPYYIHIPIAVKIDRN